MQRLGRVSIFVHCASPRHQSETAFTVTDEAVERMLAVNVLAVFRLGRLLGRHMTEQGIRGRMLFITSVHAHTPRTVPHYSVAKSALAMLTMELARALGPAGIRVNAIAPGYIAASWNSESVARTIALRRIGRPDELAQTAVALLSDRFGGYITGTTITVDGGLSLFNWLPVPE